MQKYYLKISKLWTRSKFTQNIILTGISLGLYGSTKIGFNLVVLKFFGSDAVGRYNLSLSAALLVSILIYNFFCVSLSKFSAEALGKNDHDEFHFIINSNFWGLIVFSLLSAAGFVALSDWLVKEMGGDPVLYRWGAWIIVLNNIYNYYKTFSYVNDTVARYTVLEIVSSLVFFVTLGICIRLKLQAWLLLPYVLQLGTFCVYSIIANWKYLSVVRWLRLFRTYRSQTASVLRYSLITGLGTTASMWIGNLFTLLLGRYATTRVVGYYAVVNSTVDPLNYIPRVLNMVSFPRIAFLFGQGNFKSLAIFIRRNFRRLAIICILLCALGLLVSPAITVRIFSENLVENDWLLKLVIISRFILIVSVFHIGLLSGTEYPSIPNMTGPLALMICIPFISFAYSHFGLIGLGCLTIVAALLRSLPSLIFGNRVLNTYMLCVVQAPASTLTRS